jgi:hypothetical protein
VSAANKIAKRQRQSAFGHLTPYSCAGSIFRFKKVVWMPDRTEFARSDFKIQTKLLQGAFMFTKSHFAASAAFVGLAFASVAAIADDHVYTEGPVVNVASIRTEYGKFDDYMKYLDTTWKAEQEAAKKAGYILSYRVVTVQPRGENDPDIYLVTTFKNWAALDGATAKTDAIFKQVEGSLVATNQGAVARGKIRRILGSFTGQELELK